MAPAAALKVPPEYGYVLIVAGVLVLENFFLGGSVMSVRRKIFGDDFVKGKAAKLMDEHKKAFPHASFTLGYPDMGSGRYSDLLSYEDWYRFNLAQRSHYNMLESVWGVFGLLLVGGLFHPVVYAGLGAVYAVSRILYAQGYSSSYGPKGREAGAVLGALSNLGMAGFTIFQGAQLVKPLLLKYLE